MPQSSDRERLLEEARDPATSPERLRELHAMGLPSPRLREALAENPNSPQEVLADVLRLAPAAFLRNPITTLLPLESPEFFYQIDRFPVLQLLTYPYLPLSYIRLFLDHPDEIIRDAASWHVQLAGKALPEFPDWKQEVAEVLLQLAAKDPTFDWREFRAMADLGLLKGWLVEALQTNYMMQPIATTVEAETAEEESVLQRSPDYHGVGRWFLRRTTEELSRTDFPALGSREIIWYATQIGNWGRQRRLAVKEGRLARLAIAINPSTPDQIVRILTEDGDRHVRAAAQHRMWEQERTQ